MNDTLASQNLKYALIICLLFAALAKVIVAFNSQRIMVNWANEQKKNHNLLLQQKKLKLELLTLLNNVKFDKKKYKISEIKYEQ